MYPDIVIPAIDIAAEAAAAYYDAAGDVPFGATPAAAPDSAVLRASARWALVKGTAETGLQLLQGSTHRRVFNAARETVMDNAAREPGARWARRARADACGFCRMLATRDVVYTSAKAATMHRQGARHKDHKYHDNCHCLAVAVRPGKLYKPPAYVQQWNEEYKAITRAVGINPAAVSSEWNKRLASS